MIARVLGDEWEIENIAIAGTARRRGLGTRLLGELLDMAQGTGRGGEYFWKSANPTRPRGPSMRSGLFSRADAADDLLQRS